MVRVGRRVRTLVASTIETDSCDSPKRKDQRLEFPGKFSHTLVSPNGLVKSQTITDFFQVVEDNNKIELIENDEIIDLCPVLPRMNGFKQNNYINNSDDSDSNVTEINNYNTKDEALTSTTPHRIELRTEQQTSPTSVLSQLHIALQPKKGPPSKARRRLNTNLSNNQPILTVTKDDKPIKNISTNNRTLTEYFPVRRSVRKTKRTVLEEKQKTLEQCVRSEVEEGLEIHNFCGKGRGIVASQPFCKGDFVVEYRGELISMAEAKRREIQYAQDQNTGCYMYYFKHKNFQHCVDATAESGYLGRLVNHSRNGNLVTRTVLVDGIPRLVLIAKEDIMLGEEVTYDYGDRSKESLKYHPWLAS